MVAVIVTVRLHDIAEVHHSVVDDFQVDDEVDEDEEEVGKKLFRNLTNFT